MLAGVLIDTRGSVLLAQRPAPKHMAGYWEFPGGKLEPGESPIAGLRRELAEELGIQVERARPLHRIFHTYPDRQILLDFWRVEAWSGACQALDGQALRWCTIDELDRIEIVPADEPVVTLLRLGERFVHDAAAGGSSGLRSADYIVMQSPPSPSELESLRERVNLPIYARALDADPQFVELQTQDLTG